MSFSWIVWHVPKGEIRGEFYDWEIAVHSVASARKIENGASVNQRIYGFAMILQCKAYFKVRKDLAVGRQPSNVPWLHAKYTSMLFVIKVQ